MFLRRFTDFVLQNRVQGMAVAFVIAFIPIIGSISILIAALTTLRKGVIEGAFILVAATLPYFIGYLTSTSPMDHTLLAIGMLAIIIVSNVLTWFFAIVLRRFSNWNFTLETAAVIGVLGVLIVHIWNPDIQNWWATQLDSYFAKTAEMVGKIKATSDAQQSASPDTQIQSQAVMVAKHFATGFIAVSVLFNALLQLVIARWWQATFFNPGGLRKELYQIRLGRVAGLVFVVGFILSYMGIDTVMDAMPVIYMIFFVAGLSLIHRMISVTKKSWLWLILIYMSVVWLFPLSLVIIAFVALLDTGFDFRKRFLL